MSDILIYALCVSIVFLLFILATVRKPPRHAWYEVSSTDLALATRKRKNPRRRR